MAVRASNAYADRLGQRYEKMPKAVMAAVMVSLAARLTGADDLDAGMKIIDDEWRILNHVGIVRQRPPQ